MSRVARRLRRDVGDVARLCQRVDAQRPALRASRQNRRVHQVRGLQTKLQTHKLQSTETGNENFLRWGECSAGGMFHLAIFCHVEGDNREQANEPMLAAGKEQFFHDSLLVFNERFRSVTGKEY